MNSKSYVALMVGIASAIALGGGAGARAAAQDAHQHAQGTAAHALRLNAGQRWATDEPLRQGMTRIRDALEPELSAAHSGKLSAAQYAALGKEIEGQIAYIVQNCKLEPQADQVLHVVLAELTEGNDALLGRAKSVKRSAGVVKLVRTLENYGKYFDHPGWRVPKV